MVPNFVTTVERNSMRKKYLISIVGPTAIGKTSLSITLAQHFRTEIISADSRQFFKEMSIGTAAPTAEELAAAPHHFIQHRSVEQPYSVGDFERDALHRLDELFHVHQTVIMVGGSGLYVKAVTEGLDDFPEVDQGIRKDLNKQLEDKGIVPLQLKLQELDPKYYRSMDIQNPHRLIRALEICLGTGKPYSSFRNRKKQLRDFETIQIGLTADRKVIYERINRRVDLMLAEGLQEEARQLYTHKELNALNTVGYKEMFNYIDEKWTLDFAVSEIKKNTRRFAKRQLTWFRKDAGTIWFDHNAPAEEIIEFLKKRTGN